MTTDNKRITDPMMILLAVLLVFIGTGTMFGGCSHKAERIRIGLDAAFGGDATGFAGFVNESVQSAETGRPF